jgi:hypothetical protein
MTTPFDAAIANIAVNRYHNHRLESHSDIVSEHLFADLLQTCEPLRRDIERGVVRQWLNVASPGDRARKVDLFVGEPDAAGKPVTERVRIAVENKSVITAHRNRTSRFDDLQKVLAAIHAARPEAILVATVLIGLAPRVLNIPDHVHKFFRGREEEFNDRVLPRLSSGDQSLWSEFDWAVSENTESDPVKTLRLFQTLPTRAPGFTHQKGYDFVLAVPVFIDNVGPPHIPAGTPLGIDIEAEYKRMLDQICSAYTARWHT